MEGYLKKWVNFMYQWQNRYFILHEDCLIYCQQKGSSKKGQVHLGICSIRSVQTDSLRIVINYGMSEMHLRASSVQEKEKWLDALLLTQQKLQAKTSYSLLKQRKRNPFYFLEGAPEVDLQRIHKILTTIWVLQAQLEEQISLNQLQQVQQLNQELKQNTTLCAQALDEEYNNLIEISKLLQQSRSLTNNNPPDHQDDEYIATEQFMSFKEDDFMDFHSINNELYDERQLIRRTSKTRMSVQNVGALPIIQLLDEIKINQPIKFKNLHKNDAFKDMMITSDNQREQLPSFKDPNESMKLFSLLKDMIGKDLTKIAFPVTFNEPLSMLQNLCENLEYSELLDQADQQITSQERLAYVMVWAASGLSATINRVKKPFNPILGETFELITSKFKYISEQVSHHPPISIGYAQNEHFEFLADNNVKTAFWGKSITVTPLGQIDIKLKTNGDQITFQRCKSSCKNLIMGRQYLDHYGEMKFTTQSGDVGVLNLSEGSSEPSYEIKGYVKDQKGIQVMTIQGKWNSQIQITQQNQQPKIIWKRNNLPLNHEQQYYFTQFAIQLNHINQKLLKTLPPTDSRLRPDQRSLENNNIDFAAIEKTRLEQKQRLAKKELHEQKKDYIPKWFIQKNGKYTFSNEYWQQRETQEYQTNSFDIF